MQTDREKAIPMREALESIIARLEAATGPDRGLDALLYRAVTPDLHDTIAEGTGWLVGGDHANPTKAPHLTSSLDAAIDLVEAALPGCFYMFGKGKSTSAEPLYGFQILFRSDVLGESAHDHREAAICLALCRALLAQQIETGVEHV